jgi:septum formation protein
MAEAEGRRRVILASASESRRRLLHSAGVPAEVIPSRVDEPALRRALEAGGRQPGPEAVARALAEAKAVEVSRANPDALVIGADQVLALGKRIFDKPANLEAARRQLGELRGRMHDLVSAVVIARSGNVEWTHAETATLTVRLFGAQFLDHYLAQAGEAVCQSVGAYQLEGLGAQLFERIEGDYFTILGLPLIALLAELRAREVILT